ncbi:MAG: alpha,alpha-trehalose-phosphate synthase, partial [Acidimicrobiaceae bacterium]|nr:alpha,alpha-trehalose-phosphate synthase [Acidimicrobiaceae bacterium]
MNELVVVSNRGPASLALAPDGSFEVRHAAGGLAPSLLHALSDAQGLWVASAMTEGDRKAASEGLPTELVRGTNLRLVDVPAEVSDAAYRVIANGTLWFLFHGLFDLTRRPALDRRWHEAWEGYREFNRCFAREVAGSAGEGATVVVNDYHFFLLGRELAELRPDLRTVHFTHTPFCSPEELRVLPRAIARELVGSLASYGACGFHTDRWADAYRRCADHLLKTSPVVFSAPLGT